MEDEETHGDDSGRMETDEKVWSRAYEQCFIELLVEEVKKGEKKTTTLSKSGWKAVKESLKEKLGKEYSFMQLKNKYNQLRSRQKMFKNLIMESGIHYNSLTGKVTATNECWLRVSQVNRMAKRFKKKGCKEYQELCFIFGDARTLNTDTHLSTKSLSETDDEDCGSQINAYLSSNNNEDLVAPEDVVAPSSTSHTHSQPSSSSPKHKPFEYRPERKKQKGDSSVVVEKGLTSVGDQKFTSTFVMNREVMMMKECLKALNGLGIKGAPYGKAVNALHDSSLYREVFLDMPDERKKDWVLAL